jgi:hypothetical protein
MRIDKRLFTIGLLVVVTAMVMATQYATTRLGYEFNIVHPSNANLRLIGSDNSSEGARVLRVDGANGSGAILKLAFGNFSTNQSVSYTAAFGIVNEERYPMNITNINVTSPNCTYLRIWLHGNREADASINASDNSSVLMYDNGTHVNRSNRTAWILAAGNHNASDMCSNISDRVNHSCLSSWDQTMHVRFSENNTNAASNVSDYVWIQITLNIPVYPDFAGQHIGTIFIYFETDAVP